MTPKLFTAKTIVHTHRNHLNVVFHWFVSQRKKPLPLPYEDMIENYWMLDHYKAYSEDHLQECFTEAELEKLRKYVLNEHNGEVIAAEVTLPVQGVIMGWGAIPVGGAQDFYLLCDEAAYNLDFMVWGYYDLTEAEPAKSWITEEYRELEELTQRALVFLEKLDNADAQELAHEIRRAVGQV